MDLIFFRNFRTKPAFTILLFFGFRKIDNSFTGRELSFLTQKIFGQFVHDSGIGWEDKGSRQAIADPLVKVSK